MSDENDAIKREGDAAFPVVETETPTESSPESQPTETAPESSPEAPKEDEAPQVPFHEDPKVQEYIDRQVGKRLDGELQKFEQGIAQKFSPKEETNIPNWFGGDEAQWKSYQEDQSRIIEEAKNKAVTEIESKTQVEKDRLKQANDWFESSIAELEATGLKVGRNKVLKKAMDEELVDTQGRWNYKAAAKLLLAEEQTPKPNLTAKKNLAASTTTDSKAEDKPKDYVTSADLKKMGGIW
jgi:hypothetical protein